MMWTSRRRSWQPCLAAPNLLFPSDMTVAGFFAGFVCFVLMVPVTVLFVQVIAARRVGPRSLPQIPARRSTVAVLMPAHDEASGIRAAIESVLQQLGAGDRLLVVADNCSDDTAAVALACGAEVIERCDPFLRGKGYALDHGVRHLGASPPDVVVIVDADCTVHPGALDRLAAECVRADAPVQALYLMQSPAGAGLKTRIAEFAWVLRNRVRPLGCERLGWPCQLMGTGMAFPWRAIAGASLASGHIVEDMQLGLDLAMAGTPPSFCGDALVTSVFPQSEEAIVAQRTRWEHGHIGIIASRVLPMLGRALLQRRLVLATMALDLGVPPLTSLALMLGLAWVGAALLAFLGGSVAPLTALSLVFLFFLAAVWTAWSRFGRNVVSASDWLAVPGYIVAKIPIYARLFAARQRQWVRTRREGDRP